MDKFSIGTWLMGLCTLLTLMITFIVYYHETQELISSLTAAILSASLVLGALIVLNWLIQVFTKK